MACKLPIDDIAKAVSGAVSSALSKIEAGSSGNSTRGNDNQVMMTLKYQFRERRSLAKANSSEFINLLKCNSLCTL